MAEILLNLSCIGMQALLVKDPMIVELGAPPQDEPLIRIQDAILQGKIDVSFTTTLEKGELFVQCGLRNISGKSLRLLIQSATCLFPSSEVGFRFARSFPSIIPDDLGSIPLVKQPLEGGEIPGIRVFCLEFHQEIPPVGSYYSLDTFQNEVSDSSYPLGMVIKDFRNGEIKKRLIEILPSQWSVNQEMMDILSLRILHLCIWSYMGSRCLSEPVDIILLPVVREYLKKNGIPDPYQTALKTTSESIQEKTSHIIHMLGLTSNEFEEAGDSLRREDVCIMDITSYGTLHYAVNPSPEQQIRSGDWLFQYCPDNPAKHLEALYYQLAFSIGTSKPSVLQYDLQNAEKILNETLSNLPQETFEVFKQNETLIKNQYLKSAVEESDQSLEQAFNNDSFIPPQMKLDWESLSIYEKSAVLLYLRFSVESGSMDQGVREAVSQSHIHAPAGVLDFLKSWAQPFDKFSQRMSDYWRNLRENTLSGNKDLSPWNNHMDNSNIPEDFQIRIGDALFDWAQRKNRWDKFQKALQNPILDFIKIQGKKEMEILAQTVEIEKKDLKGFEALLSLREAIKGLDEKDILLLQEDIPGIRTIKVLVPFLKRIRSHAASAERILLRLPRELENVNVFFWNGFFHGAGIKGFEKAIHIIQTDRKDIRASLERIQYTPKSQPFHLFVFTIPTSLTENEFRETQSSFIRSFKNTYPRFSSREYNDFVGKTLEEEKNRILELIPRSGYVTNHEQLMEQISRLGLHDDIAVSLTLVSHRIGSELLIEFPDRPEGVKPEDLKREIASIGERLGKRINLEFNLITCHGRIGMADLFLDLKQSQSTFAPRGEIPPILGLYLYRKALEIPNPELSLLERMSRACQEYLDRFLHDKNLPDNLKLESPDSCPEPRVEFSPHDFENKKKRFKLRICPTTLVRG